ncbi:MAG: TolC family protein [Bacteroidota bacterium]
MKKILFICFSMLFISNLNAQKKWTLQECIEYAHEHNIQVKQQGLNTQINETMLKESKLDALPSLNAGASHNLSYGRALDETTYEYTENQEVQSSNFSVNSSLTLFQGLQKWNRIKQNKFSLKSELASLEKMKNDISLNVASAYLQILFNQELVEVSQNQLDITQQQIKRTQELVEAGNLAKGSLLEIKSQAANEEMNLVNAQNQLESSYLNLTQLLELDSIGDFDIARPDFSEIEKDIPLKSVDSIYSVAVEELPRVESAKYNMEARDKALDVAKGRLSPTLSLRFAYGSRYSSIRDKLAGYDETTVSIGETVSGEEVIATQRFPTYSDYSFSDQLQDNANTSIMLNLSIPIFDGLKANYSVDNARVDKLSAEYSLESTKNELYKDIQSARSDALSAWKKYAAAKKTVESMEMSFKYTKQKFEVGLVNSVEYNTAKNNLTEAKSDLLQAKYEYIFKTRILDFYQGNPLEI